MRNLRNILTLLFLFFFIVAAGGGLFWANLNFTQRVPGGADFIVPWKAMQNFMMQGVTPYGELTTLNIQSLIYDRPLPAGQYPYRANIPLFMLLFYLPFAWIREFVLARAIWLMLLELGLFGVVLISLRMARWNPHWLIFLFIMLFSVFWLPSVSMLMTATAIILQALVMQAALRSIETGSDELAGALAALSLLNIEATGLAFLALVVWSFSTRRWRILGGIAMMLTILMALSFLLLPNWILPFFGAVLTNFRSGLIPSTYNIFEHWLPGIGVRLAQILSVSAFVVLFLEWRSVRRQGVHWLFWTVCLSTAIAPLLGIPYFPQWLVFTLPGVLLVLSVMAQRWKFLGYVSSVLLVLVVFLGLWWAQLNSITSVFILFYPLILVLFLYWVRWGAVRQPRLWADEIVHRV
ncbi:MAG TPA: glycosyltransferase 87 family protein [Anaerolineales bacterium]|jgi:hypothetical protein